MRLMTALLLCFFFPVFSQKQCVFGCRYYPQTEAEKLVYRIHIKNEQMDISLIYPPLFVATLNAGLGTRDVIKRGNWLVLGVHPYSVNDRLFMQTAFNVI